MRNQIIAGLENGLTIADADLTVEQVNTLADEILAALRGYGATDPAPTVQSVPAGPALTMTLPQVVALMAAESAAARPGEDDYIESMTLDLTGMHREFREVPLNLQHIFGVRVRIVFQDGTRTLHIFGTRPQCRSFRSMIQSIWDAGSIACDAVSTDERATFWATVAVACLDGADEVDPEAMEGATHALRTAFGVRGRTLPRSEPAAEGHLYDLATQVTAAATSADR